MVNTGSASDTDKDEEMSRMQSEPQKNIAKLIFRHLIPITIQFYQEKSQA